MKTNLPPDITNHQFGLFRHNVYFAMLDTELRPSFNSAQEEQRWTLRLRSAVDARAYLQAAAPASLREQACSTGQWVRSHLSKVILVYSFK